MLKKIKNKKAEEPPVVDDKKKAGSVSPRPSRPASVTPSTATAIPTSSTRPSLAVVEDQRPSTSAVSHPIMVHSADRLRPTPAI
uniref:Uncharacterized protein n=1 Tax=Ditylenchus dipsaci TaxID=166011 RepID=A0A915EL14_9BILA